MDKVSRDEIFRNPITQQHMLQGLRYSETRHPEDKVQWMLQLQRNHLTRIELVRLGTLFNQNGIRPTLLKGFRLLGDIYEDWGIRFASDVDLLVDIKEMLQIERLLREDGYHEILEKKWLGNDFKKVFCKDLADGSITLEFHSRLFWHVPQVNHPTEDSVHIPGYRILSPEAQLIHLCGHLAFQHTFIKLFWLVDIEYFLAKYQDRINWSKFWDQAEVLKIKVSCAICLDLADSSNEQSPPLTFADQMKYRLLKILVSNAFLLEPRKHPWRYFLTKFLCKDQLADNIRYLKKWRQAKTD